MSEEFNKVYDELSALIEGKIITDKYGLQSWEPSNDYKVNTTPVTPRDVIIYNIETNYTQEARDDMKELLGKLKSGSTSFTDQEQKSIDEELSKLNKICYELSVKAIPTVVNSEVNVVNGKIDFPDNHLRLLYPVAVEINDEDVKFSTYAFNVKLKKGNYPWDYTGKAKLYYTTIARPCTTIDDTIFDTRLPVEFLADCLQMRHREFESTWRWFMGQGISQLKREIAKAGLSNTH